MFRLTINLEAIDPPLSLPSAVELRAEMFVANTDEGHSTLSRLMELIGVPENDSDPEFPGHP